MNIKILKGFFFRFIYVIMGFFIGILFTSNIISTWLK